VIELKNGDISQVTQAKRRGIEQLALCLGQKQVRVNLV